ncbi:hypothetical protein ZIOFF_019374 [Zingiber officinale]|uniref:Uncharacterized protein n=1 Tax=Zingiber officinale TaxID=94328 RepID=A0A8J5HE67_ZINOF|nr:hypothetical protein ZIOFF_019374 [Zingiber officinale]
MATHEGVDASLGNPFTNRHIRGGRCRAVTYSELKDQFSSSDVFFKDLKSLKKVRELQAVERHLAMCAEARKVVDWKSDLKESDAAFIEGANASSFVNSY